MHFSSFDNAEDLSFTPDLSFHAHVASIESIFVLVLSFNDERELAVREEPG